MSRVCVRRSLVADANAGDGESWAAVIQENPTWWPSLHRYLARWIARCVLQLQKQPQEEEEEEGWITCTKAPFSDSWSCIRYTAMDADRAPFSFVPTWLALPLLYLALSPLCSNNKSQTHSCCSCLTPVPAWLPAGATLLWWSFSEMCVSKTCSPSASLRLLIWTVEGWSVEGEPTCVNQASR